MGYRVTDATVRPSAIVVRFNGAPLNAYPGETIAAALIANDIRAFRRDSAARARGPYCNMGTCFECLIEMRVRAADGAPAQWRRVRACLTAVTPDLELRTAEALRSLAAFP